MNQIERNEKYLSDKDLAARYGVGRVTPWRWAKNGTFPAPIKLGKNCTRWKLSDIQIWEASQKEVQA